jgi:hypothetical protein
MPNSLSMDVANRADGTEIVVSNFHSGTVVLYTHDAPFAVKPQAHLPIQQHGPTDQKLDPHTRRKGVVRNKQYTVSGKVKCAPVSDQGQAASRF